MINLLPPKNKEGLLEEENWKMIIILGINILAVLICFSLILHSINVFIAGEVNSQKIIYEQKEKELASPPMQNLEQGLITFNKTLYDLDRFYQNQYRAAKALEELSEIIPPDIYLTNLSLNLKSPNNKIGEGLLAGFSPTRESLLKLKENLEKAKRISSSSSPSLSLRENSVFEEIYFPPTSWIKPTNIDFQASFKIKY